VWDSNQFAWYYKYLIDQRAEQLREDPDSNIPLPDPIDIPYRPDVAQAFAAEYYRNVDLGGRRTVGTLISKSVPVEQGWTVSATLGKASLQRSITLGVVALCTPLAADVGKPGVLGVAFRTASGKGTVTAACAAGERLTSVGFTSSSMNGVASAAPTATLAGASILSLEGTETVTAVCVRGEGLATTSATGSTTVTGGWDGSTSATCPSGYTAVGGGLAVEFQPQSGKYNSAPQATSSMTPIGSTTFGAAVRGLAAETPQNPSSRGLIDVPYGNFATPLVVYASHDRAALTVTAICAKRVLG
jgi:hypothetical protein